MNTRGERSWRRSARWLAALALLGCAGIAGMGLVRPAPAHAGICDELNDAWWYLDFAQFHFEAAGLIFTVEAIQDMKNEVSADALRNGCLG